MSMVLPNDSNLSELSPVPGTRPRYAVIGTSHAVAIMRAGRRAGRNDILVRNVTRDPQWEACKQNPQLYLRGVDPVTPFFSVYGGNYHNIFGLIEHPVRFDFIPPGTAQGEIAEGRALVPYDVLYERFKRDMEARIFSKIRRFRHLFSGPFYQALPPPILPDDEYVAKHAGVVFSGKLDLGITPRDIRLKLYNLYSAVCIEFCAEIGISVLHPPAEAADDEGFLRRKFWADATHGNVEYGALVLEQMDGIVARSS